MRVNSGRVRALAVAVTVLLVIGSGLVWGSGQTESAKPSAQPLKVGYLPFAGFGPIYLAQEKGWFKDAGVNVDLILFDSGPPLLTAMAAGKIDVGALGAVPTIRTSAEKVFDLRIISVEADVSGTTELLAGPGINTVQELRGKKVSVPFDTTSDYYLGRVLAKFGMTKKDVNLINMEVQDAAAAFIAGRIDAFVPAPAAIDRIISSRQGAHILFRSQDFTKGPGDTTPLYIYDLWVARKSVLDARLPDVEKVLRVYHGQVVKYVTSPQTVTEAAAGLQDWLQHIVGAKATVAEATDQLNLRHYFDIQQMKTLADNGLFEKMVHDQAQFMQQVGIIKQLPDFSTAMDYRAIKGM